MQNEPIRCVHNPSGGREADFGMGTLHRASNRKKIAVIGGGPAGLKVAEIAARRGHIVSVYEKEAQLGGQLRIASLIPLRKEVLNVIRYLSGQVKQLGVEIHLNEEIDQDSVQKIQADVFVIATGSYPASSSIPGSEQSNVTTAWNVLLERTQVGKRAVVYDITRRWPGLGTAEFLADKGVKVYVLTPAYVVGEQIPPGSVTMVFQRILEKGVEMIPMCEVARVQGRTVTVHNLFSRRDIILEDIDTVVMSVGNVSNRNLYDVLKGQGKEVYDVGDAVAPRLIQQCIFEAEVLARSL
jgi:pyruvate/2-oxoglutarate dehydrogenase complex dihydrolipoamide dehydrogenase (E3) component